MEFSIKDIGKSLISLLIIAGFVYYLYGNRNAFSISLVISWFHIATLGLLILISWIANCLQLILLLRMEGVRVGFWENMLIQAATLMGNYLPMRIGSLIRFRYFKKVHGLNYLKFGGIVGLRTVILLTLAGLFGCIGAVGLASSGTSVGWNIYVVFVCMLLIPSLCFLTPLSKFLRRRNLTSGLLSDFLSSFVTIRRHPGTIFSLIGLLLLQNFILAARLYVSFDAVQVDITWWTFLILAPTTTILSFLSITPGNLALREWVIGILSAMAGYDFSSGVFAGTVDRAILLVTTFVFGTMGILFVAFRFKKASENR